jgi:DNA-binding XRE family transcriptional regulator
MSGQTKKRDELQNQLKAVRTRLGMSQQDLATAAGVARQTIGGIEAGTYALSLTVALRLAKTLGCSVEELFWLEGDLPTVEATLTGESGTDDLTAPLRVALAQVGGRWVASALSGEQAFRREMVPADGIATWDAMTGKLAVQLLDTPDSLAETVMLAGCTPALSLWARSAERWYPGFRVHWSHANSMAALERLARGEAHIAGVHLLNPETGEENAPFVRKALPGVACVLVNLGVWEPLRSVRYDLALRKSSLELSSIQQLLGTLHHRWVRSQLSVLGGYDTSRTGEIVDV